MKQQEIAASRQGAKSARRLREALQKRADNAEKHVSQIRARQHSDEKLARAAEAYQQHRRVLEGYQRISNAGLTVYTRHTPLTGVRGMSEVPESQQIPQREMRGISKIPQRHNSMLRELSMPLPIIGQGNVEITSSTSSPDSITRMEQVALEENKDADPEKSALARVGIKIPHPGTYSGSADLEELEIFVAGVL